MMMIWFLFVTTYLIPFAGEVSTETYLNTVLLLLLLCVYCPVL